MSASGLKVEYVKPREDISQEEDHARLVRFIMADATEENFSQQGRPDKWQELAESTIKKRKKAGHWPGQILQVEGRLASSITTQYDDESAVIGSNLDYAAIHQLGGQAGKNKSASIPARPYLSLSNEDLEDILDSIKNYLNIQ